MCEKIKRFVSIFVPLLSANADYNKKAVIESLKKFPQETNYENFLDFSESINVTEAKLLSIAVFLIKNVKLIGR